MFQDQKHIMNMIKFKTLRNNLYQGLNKKSKNQET